MNTLHFKYKSFITHQKAMLMPKSSVTCLFLIRPTLFWACTFVFWASLLVSKVLISVRTSNFLVLVYMWQSVRQKRGMSKGILSICIKERYITIGPILEIGEFNPTQQKIKKIRNKCTVYTQFLVYFVNNSIYLTYFERLMSLSNSFYNL